MNFHARGKFACNCKFDFPHQLTGFVYREHFWINSYGRFLLINIANDLLTMHCSYFRIGFDNTQACLLPALCLIWKALSSKGSLVDIVLKVMLLMQKLKMFLYSCYGPTESLCTEIELLLS